MPPLLSITAILFVLCVFSHTVFSEDVFEPALNHSSICALPPSPLLTFNPVALNPTCSLSSRPADPAPEFLSFEEWKAKQLAVQESANGKDKDSHAPTTKSNTGNKQDNKNQEEEVASTSNGHKDADVARDVVASVEANDTEHATPSPSAPKYHIPLIDRFNYASNECNARIHSSHKSAKSSSSILSRKKDRYMLSPCQLNKEKHFVVVELCEDIRIDTVQLANFEFFSGVFKDIRVSAAETYTSDGKGWTVVGEYTAKNIRGIQSFHPQKELLRFYRYLRVEFLSYYGKEYFCPVSLLRVYGLTQMEEWKSDLWKAEWEASQAASIDAVTKEPEDTVIILGAGSLSASASSGYHIPSTDSAPSTTSESSQTSQESKDPPQRVESASSENKTAGSRAITESLHEIPSTSHPIPATGGTLQSQPTESRETSESQETSLRQTQSSDGHHVVEEVPTSSDEKVSSTPPPTTSTPATSAENGYNEPTTSVVTRTVSTTIILSAATPSSSTAIPNGESVYRMIMNRISSLEANQTLYARYVEEQGRSVNIRLELIEEDIGRLGAVMTSQQQRIKKMFERHRIDTERAHNQLAAQVEHLAHEVLMEKRLGILQLVLLLTVLVFMALTRGSRGEPIRLRKAGLVWHKNLRNSADWVTGWRGSASRLPSPDGEHVDSQPNDAIEVAFNLEDSPMRRLQDPPRRPRRSSSQRSARYDDVFQTPPRKSRTVIRSRQNSTHSRNHTPLGAFRRSSNNNMRATDSATEMPSASKRAPLGVIDRNGQEDPKQPYHKETWRASGRSVSLSGANPVGLGLGVGGSTGNLPDSRNHGSMRRLAKTAHLHEVKNATQRSRGNTVDELRPPLVVSVLSPMTEASTPGFTPNPQTLSHEDKSGPTRITGFESSELRGVGGPPAARSEGVLSDLFSIPTSSSLVSPQAIPFPSPGNRGLSEGEQDREDDDVWVDDEQPGDGDPDEREIVQRSPRTKRSRFSFGSPRKPFVFSSSPPAGTERGSGMMGGGGRGRFRFSKRSDVSMGSIPRG
ncbi:Uncharacterized protein slp1 {ECO:0000250/UniProtKB:Q12232} AltName: Full=SUN-like protein 1 {ECO:0000250/UniProtKB:Q12232}; Flags: Precursor [Serendipita indica DSM 11827]|nr:Uncharacterized protein slp1 {ECO:0000250/UniProtKB:Q12232} AltName: Full=SUN-like protein 1 {ECO:0000250/UniProtKB:Q12232}; Flags: Precursor [Serendipita indica DSM 11827]